MFQSLTSTENKGFVIFKKNDYFKVGDTVRHDDVIGLTGVSGYNGDKFETCNPHLHFEVRNTKNFKYNLEQRCNPSMYFDFKSEHDLSEEEKKYQEKLRDENI